MSYHEKPGHFLFWSAPRPLRFQIEWSVAHASRADESIFCRVRLIGICRCLHFRVRVPLERRTRRRERGSEKREARHHGKGEEQQYIHTYIYILRQRNFSFFFLSSFLFFSFFFFSFFFRHSTIFRNRRASRVAVERSSLITWSSSIDISIRTPVRCLFVRRGNHSISIRGNFQNEALTF